MEPIVVENLLKELQELTSEQTIFIDFPDEINRELQLLILQAKSAENLFMSYINNTSELANQFNMTKFLNFYADLIRKKDTLFEDTALQLLGSVAYKYASDSSNKIMYSLDFRLSKLLITKQGLFSMNTCSACSTCSH